MILGGWDLMEAKGRCYNARREYRFDGQRLRLLRKHLFWPGKSAPTTPGTT